MQREKLAEYGLKEGYYAFCADGLSSIQTYDQAGRSSWASCKEHYVAWPQPVTYSAFSEENMEVRGQRVGSEFLDEVTLYPAAWDYRNATSDSSLMVTKLTMSREAQPRVQSIRVEFKKLMVGTGSPRFNGVQPGADEDRELLDDPSRPALECAVTAP